MAKKVFSFDVFDTCITRSCGSGDDVFYLLACSVMPNASETCKRDFAACRKNAEKECINETGNEAPNIDQIYEYFDVSLFSNKLDKISVREKEQKIEYQSWIPVLKVQKMLEKCRRNGKVIFISDMYLPCKFIYPKLKEIGVIKEGEQLYVSCDFGETKRSGNLYKIVSQKEHLNYKEWIHYGDDKEADYNSPKKVGLSAILINNSFSNYEKKWYDKGRLFSNEGLKIYASVTRSVRLSNFLSNNDEVSTSLSASAFIPSAIKFVRDIYKGGIKKIFFASRDTYYMFLAAKSFFSNDEDVDIRYFHISTKVLYPLIIEEGTAKELMSMFRLIYSFKPSSILKMLDIDKEKCKEIEQKVDIENEIFSDGIEAEYFAKVLVSVVGSKWLKKTCKEKKKRFLEYSKQQGLYSDTDTVALIDLGWRGTSQLILRKIGFTNVIFGYFGMLGMREPFYKIGDSFTFCYNEDKPELDIYRYIIEYYLCTTDQGSTIDYKNNKGLLEPMYSSIKIDSTQKEMTILTVQIIKKLSFILRQYKFLIENSIDEIFNICTIETIRDFLSSPPKHILEQMQPYLVYNHFGATEQILGYISIKDIVYYVFYQLIGAKLHLHRPTLLKYRWTTGSEILGMGKHYIYVRRLINFLDKFKKSLLKL